jgi:hypothetical protein
MALQRLEASLHAFTDGGLDDDVAMLAIGRASHGGSAGPETEVWARPARAAVSIEGGHA